MLSPYLEIFYKTNRNFEYKSVMYVCLKHTECGQTMAIVAPFSVATQLGSPIPSTQLTLRSSCYGEMVGHVIGISLTFPSKQDHIGCICCSRYPPDGFGMEGKSR